MEFLLDNDETERIFQQLLQQIRVHKNGVVADVMKQQGVDYKMNWGVSITDLRAMAGKYAADHLLALKLWNKQWRESMILATLLDNPADVTEKQMDFWTRSFENSEIAEQASANLWVRTPFAFIKALEWCRGKRHLIRYTGIHLIGRLAITMKGALDEMFEPFFEELAVLGRDPRLYTVIYRAVIALGNRSEALRAASISLAEALAAGEQESAVVLGRALLEEINAWE
jgi:hypothetical protein